MISLYFATKKACANLKHISCMDQNQLNKMHNGKSEAWLITLDFHQTFCVAVDVEAYKDRRPAVIFLVPTFTHGCQRYLNKHRSC